MKSVLENRIKGALYGFAIGDAMGATTEFMTSDQIKARYGQVDEIIGGGWLGLKAGQVTDDTQMSMCVMDALMYGNFEKSVIDNFIKWYKSNPPDVGNQCAKGINYLMRGLHIPVDDKALGNGALMRALPCALVGDRNKNTFQQRLTHNNETNDTCVRLYNDIIDYAIEFGHEVEVLIPRPNNLMHNTGCVVDALNNAFYYVNWSTSFKDCIIHPVNDGGDADTVAAITGGLGGAIYGFDNIPVKWVKQLDEDVKSKLDEFTTYAIMHQNRS